MREGDKRCFGDGKKYYERYHDFEWGVPSYDDRYLFELLILEGAQAGLSWDTVLRKREAYKRSFYDFEPEVVAQMSDIELERLLLNPEIIRNRLKVFSVRQNAKAFLEIQKQFGSFSNYIWAYVGNTPIVNYQEEWKKVPAESDISKKISKDLKKRGMNFVGPSIIYAYMQAIGMVDDHLISCPCKKKRASL